MLHRARLAALSVLAATVALSFGSTGTVIEGAVDDYQADLAARVNQLRDNTGLTAVAAAVIVDGELVGAAASGERRRDSGISVTVDDRWHVGSITKSMTATLLAVAGRRRTALHGRYAAGVAARCRDGRRLERLYAASPGDPHRRRSS